MQDTTGASAFHDLWDRGYHRLVPIIPPGAPVHKDSKIAARARAGDDARGKVPGTRRSDGNWVGMSLVAMESQRSDLDTWAAMGASVGIKTGEGLIAIDIDTTDQKAAALLNELAARHLGHSRPRIGRAPKCLLPYRAPADMTYRQVRFSTDTEERALLEVLAEGRQFVAHGTHPGTGRPYTWPQGIPDRDALTEITHEQLSAFLEAAAAALGGDVRTSGTAREAPDQERLQAPSWDVLTNTVDAIPNTSALFKSRNDYITMAYAIKGAAPDGYEHEALDVFLDWCERWEDDVNDPDTAMEDWRKAKPPVRVGYSFLQSHAPSLFFEDVSKGEAKEETDDMFAAAAEAAKPQRFQLLTIDDVFKLPPPRFLIDRYIPQDGFGILYGDPGSGKSFVALDMALALAHDLPDWHGDRIDRNGRGGVLYIAGEGAHGFSNRIRAWQKDRLLPEGGKPDFHFLFQHCNFMRQEDVKNLIETVTDAHPEPLSLIVVDTVSRAIPGADENLQKDMTIFVNACEALKAATGAFVLGVHHTAKSGDMRGSSVFLGQADAVLALKRQKGRNVASLHVAKQKDAADGWHEPFRMSEIDLDDRGTSLRIEKMEPGSEVSEGRLTEETSRQMLGLLADAWEAGEPLSPEARAKGRYAPRILSEATQVPAWQIEGVLDLWLQTGVLGLESASRGGRKRGYRVVGEAATPGRTGSEGGVLA